MMLGLDIEVIKTPNGGVEFIRNGRQVIATGGTGSRVADADRPVIRLGPEETRKLREFLEPEFLLE